MRGGSNYIKGKKKITLDEIIKITNLAENYNVSELIDNCLAKNSKKTVNILSENNFSPEDCIIITRTLLMKSKRLHNLISNNNETKNAPKITPLKSLFFLFVSPMFHSARGLL